MPSARKRFGQHFLTQHAIIEKIVCALQPQSDDHLIEIGAGPGALTHPITEIVKHLYVIEIDRDLCKNLRTQYPNSKVTLFEQDALTFDFTSLCSPEKKMRIFGNLPYNISTPLLFHLLQYAPHIKDMLFMLQKEVVARLVALPSHNTYGRLSVMIQYACQVKRLFDVAPHAFSPPPKVMSSIVTLRPYAKKPYVAKDFTLFSKIVATAFQHRRKTLKNALRSLVSTDIFEKIDLDPLRRPETLSVEEYVKLSNLCTNNSV